MAALDDCLVNGFTKAKHDFYRSELEKLPTPEQEQAQAAETAKMMDELCGPTAYGRNNPIQTGYVASAPEPMHTLSAPARRSASMSPRLLTPPPTVIGM